MNSEKQSPQPHTEHGVKLRNMTKDTQLTSEPVESVLQQDSLLYHHTLHQDNTSNLFIVEWLFWYQRITYRITEESRTEQGRDSLVIFIVALFPMIEDNIYK